MEVSKPKVLPVTLSGRLALLWRLIRAWLATHRVSALIVLLAFAQGTTYLFLLPPWQHYDEPTHFEYVWLTADLGRRPIEGDQNERLRRQIAASMIAHGFYNDTMPPPDLTSDTPVQIGFSVLAHPPAYYYVASAPLHLLKEASIETQLYAVRSVSLLFYLLTIIAAIGLMRDLTPTGHMLRWAVPLLLVLLPPFNDVMTSVNSDVAATLVASLFLWNAVRLVRYGPTWKRSAIAIGLALLGVMVKNTSVFLVLLLPVTFLVAWSVQWRFPWQRLVLPVVLIAALLLPALISWGDAAYWYRWVGVANQATNTQVVTSEAPFGDHALLLETQPGNERHVRLLNPVLAEQVPQLVGQTITLGGWLWADRPLDAYLPGIAIGNRPGMAMEYQAPPIQLTTEPTFYAWTFDVPADIQAINVALMAPDTPADAEQAQLFLDGAVLAVGSFPTDAPPDFHDSAATSGIWAGKSFTNVLRNASAEVAWARFSPWVEPNVTQFVSFGYGRNPSQLLGAAFDLERTTSLLFNELTLLPFDNLFNGLAWGHVLLEVPGWRYVVRGLLLLSFLGAVIWWVRRNPTQPVWLKPALGVLALAALIVWFNTTTRTLPRISDGFVLPIARYTYPAILVTTLLLVGGWSALWGRRLQRYAVPALLSMAVLWNITVIVNAWVFYYTV